MFGYSGVCLLLLAIFLLCISIFSFADDDVSSTVFRQIPLSQVDSSYPCPFSLTILHGAYTGANDFLGEFSASNYTNFSSVNFWNSFELKSYRSLHDHLDVTQPSIRSLIAVFALPHNVTVLRVGFSDDVNFLAYRYFFLNNCPPASSFQNTVFFHPIFEVPLSARKCAPSITATDRATITLSGDCMPQTFTVSLPQSRDIFVSVITTQFPILDLECEFRKKKLETDFVKLLTGFFSAAAVCVLISAIAVGFQTYKAFRSTDDPAALYRQELLNWRDRSRGPGNPADRQEAIGTDQIPAEIAASDWRRFKRRSDACFHRAMTSNAFANLYISVDPLIADEVSTA